MKTTLLPWRAGFGMTMPTPREMADLMNRLFEEDNNGAVWVPRVDVEETAEAFVVKADLPGVDPKAVEVAVENGVLTIRGEKKEEKEEKKKDYHRIERFTGAFYRAVPLPSNVDADKVSATSDKGVVFVTIPKKREALPKKIAVTPKG
jgi:HSP20 family protein